MEYIYAAMILHSADKDINEGNIKSIIEAAGITADDGRIKALVAALEEVDIEEAMETTAMAAAPVASAGASAGATSSATEVVAEVEEEEEEEEEDDEAAEEEAAAGLGALFG
ncbi:MAG: 50S ribosomal protein P1 [Methanobacteriaceae archaeon]|jgi:large subunit ribosomal protein L12|nr:50S ribosomal protein P1 [Candidatus Methanorudis spinitermitis]